MRTVPLPIIQQLFETSGYVQAAIGDVSCDEFHKILKICFFYNSDIQQ